MNSENKIIQELNRFIDKHECKYNPKTKKWKPEFHHVVGTKFVKTENSGYYQNYHIKWKLGQDTTRLLNCAYCFRKLRGKQRKYCSDNCRNLAKMIRDEAEEQDVFIIHSENRIKGRLYMPQMKDFTVKYPDGRIGKLRTKSGKQKEIKELDFMSLN